MTSRPTFDRSSTTRRRRDCSLYGFPTTSCASGSRLVERSSSRTSWTGRRRRGESSPVGRKGRGALVCRQPGGARHRVEVPRLQRAYRLLRTWRLGGGGVRGWRDGIARNELNG